MKRSRAIGSVPNLKEAILLAASSIGDQFAVALPNQPAVSLDDLVVPLQRLGDAAIAG